MFFGQFKCKTRLFATWLITPKHDFLRLDRHRQNTSFCDLAIQELNEDRKMFLMKMWFGAHTCYSYLDLRSVITEYEHGNAKCTVQKIITYHKYAEATSLFSLNDQLIINTEADKICFEHFTCTYMYLHTDNVTCRKMQARTQTFSCMETLENKWE